MFEKGTRWIDEVICFHTLNTKNYYILAFLTYPNHLKVTIGKNSTYVGFFFINVKLL